VSSNEATLMEIAAAVADGHAIDWASAAANNPALQATVDELRIVADLATAHRQAADESDAAGDAPPRPAAPLRIGSWGPLELRKEIGSGFFGTVYLAWDPSLEREVALKILRSSDRSADVIREGRLLARVNHQNVVTIHGAYRYDEADGLWMEYIDGLTLKDSLETHGVFGSRDAARVGVDLCAAVAAVHAKGLLHRDIKAQNVMREAATGRTVLMDFGTGEQRGQQDGLWRRMTGTPLYLAPEVFAGQPATIASDIYSLGVLLFHLVTRRFPVEGADMAALEAAHAASERSSVAARRPDLPASLACVIDVALDPDPGHRHRSAEAMRQALLRAFEPPRSVAVLPFDIAPGQDIQHVRDGLADELIAGLAHGTRTGLRVASRGACYCVGNPHDIAGVCRQLDVEAVLTGSMRIEGDRVRIAAQLVAADGETIWSALHERPMTDLLAVQEEIAHGVVESLSFEPISVPRRRLTRQHTDNPKAYELYLRGRLCWLRRYSKDGLVLAHQHFHDAITEDAGYGLAHAGLADTYVFAGFYSLQQPRAAFDAASAAVRRAAELGPELPETHVSRALIAMGRDWNWKAAEQELRRAIALDPGHALARIYLSWLMVIVGDLAASGVYAREAQELEPVSPLINAGAAYALFLARRYEDAVPYCEKALEFEPRFIIAIYIKGMCRAQQGRLVEAIALMNDAATMSKDEPFYLGLLGNFYGRAGAIDQVDAVLGRLEQRKADRYVPPHCYAYIYAGLNDLDRAMDWELKALDDGASPFNYVSPIVENMNAHPRRADEFRRLGLRA
jgi:eukaryotic-like serine/threonine-protein kinase